MKSLSSTLQLIAEQIKDPATPRVFDPKKLTPEDIKRMNVKINIHASDISYERYVLAFVVEAGLKEDFMKVLQKGKAGWTKFWGDVEDKSMQLALKGLKTVEQVKAFVAKHPNLKWALLAGLLLGYLALPPDAVANIIDAPTASSLANGLDVSIAPNALSITADPGWVQDVIMKTVQDGGSPEHINHDLIKNIASIVWQKAKAMGLEDDSRRELAKTIFQGVIKGGAKLLRQYGIQYTDDIDPFSSLPC